MLREYRYRLSLTRKSVAAALEKFESLPLRKRIPAYFAVFAGIGVATPPGVAVVLAALYFGRKWLRRRRG